MNIDSKKERNISGYFALVIIILLIYIVAKDYSCNQKKIITLENELNSTKEKLDKLQEQYDLNINIPLAEIINNTKLDCDALKGKTPHYSINELPSEKRTMCKIIQSIKTYQNEEGNYFFDQSSGLQELSKNNK